MEYIIEENEGNKVFSDSLEVLEPSSCMTKHEYKYTRNLRHETEYRFIVWNWNKPLKINNASPFIQTVRLNLENVLNLDKSDKIQSTNDEVVFNSKAISVFNSGFHIGHELLISFNIRNLLFCFNESMIDSVDKLHLMYSQEYIILLPIHDVEYASKFYSLRKIDSLFKTFDFKASSILELFKLFPETVDVCSKICFQKTDENNLISACVTSSKLNFLDKEKCLSSICTDVGEACFASKITNPSKKKQSSFHDISNFKSHSLKSDDYSVDLIKTYKHICFPMKRCINAFQKQRKTSMNRIYNVFTKNRQFRGRAPYQNYQRSKRFYFAKDVNHSTNADCLPLNITENGDCCSIEEDFKDQKLLGRQVKSKIAEIRQRVENLTRGVNYELNRREQHHISFIEQCERICDSTISFQDFNEIYHTESLKNKMEMSCSDETYEDSLSKYRNVSSRYEERHQSKTFDSLSQVLMQNQTSVPYVQVLNHHKVSNSSNHVQNLSEASNFHKQILKQSEVLSQKYPSYLEKILENFLHQVAVVLNSISVPFVASLFGKK